MKKSLTTIEKAILKQIYTFYFFDFKTIEEAYKKIESFDKLIPILEDSQKLAMNQIDLIEKLQNILNRYKTKTDKND